jgi:TfoX/Sxy family transcriptional regulator of competence genes
VSPPAAYDAPTAARIRHLLSDRSDVAEKKMVGGLSFLVGGNMCCGVTGAALMIRVGADARDQVLAEPHVRPMQFGARSLSGFVCVDPPGFATDDALSRWLARALSFTATLPSRPAPPSKPA